MRYKNLIVSVFTVLAFLLLIFISIYTLNSGYKIEIYYIIIYAYILALPSGITYLIEFLIYTNQAEKEENPIYNMHTIEGMIILFILAVPYISFLYVKKELEKRNEES